METITEILGNTTDEELAVLVQYYDAVFTGQNYKASFNNIQHQEKATTLIVSMQRFSKKFFLSMLEYDEMVLNLADRLEIELKPDSLTDYIEFEIAKYFVIYNYDNIPEEQKCELAKILGCTGTKRELKKQINQAIETNLQSLTMQYTFLVWLANTAFATFLDKGSVWEPNGSLNKFLRKFVFGDDLGFRTGLILPIINISMLRYKQRYQCESGEGSLTQ
jgi:hypothetical protein